MSTETSRRAATEAFLARFFAVPNRFTLPDIEAGLARRAESISPWIALLRQTEPAPAILPCWRGSGAAEWYGVAFSERQLRGLSEDLLAFVGPTFSTFRGARGEFDSSDPIDVAVLEYTGGHALKFDAPPGREAGAALLGVLDLMRTVQSRRPAQVYSVPRSTGRVLRDFFIAIRAGDREGVEQQLRYLSDELRLDPVNILFLRVQGLAEVGEWAAILTRPELPDLLKMRRPVAVTDALLRAVYHQELATFEYADDAVGASHQFQDVLLPRFAALLGARSGLRSAEAIKSFMLLAVAGPTPSPALRDELLVVPDLEPGDATWLRRLSGLLETKAPERVPGSLADAFASENRGDFDATLEIAMAAAPSVERTKLLIDCAYELQTLAAMNAALEAVDNLGAADRAAVVSDRRRRESHAWLLNQVEMGAGASSPVPGNWWEWLEAIARDPSWAGAQQVARQGAFEWSLSEFLSYPGGASAFAEKLELLGDREALHNAVPHILGFLQADPEWPRRECADVYRGMLEVLVHSTTGGDDDFIVFYQLAQALLALGMPSAQYSQLTGYVIDILQEYPALSRLDWGLDMLDLLVIYTAPRPDILLNVLTAVVAQFQRFSRRAEHPQWELLQALCGDLGYPDLISAVLPTTAGASRGADFEATDPLTLLGQRSVGIYTLTERTGRRTAEVLARMCPGIRVHLSSDHVGTDRLRQLARSVDILLMATASAKHAATNFIEANRPSSLPTLRPAGKGTASMLRALRDYVVSVASQK